MHCCCLFVPYDCLVSNIPYWLTQTSEHDTVSLNQVNLEMAAPKLGRQRMAIAAEGASAQSHVEIVKAAKSPAVLDLLGGSLIFARHTCVMTVSSARANNNIKALICCYASILYLLLERRCVYYHMTDNPVIWMILVTQCHRQHCCSDTLLIAVAG